MIDGSEPVANEFAALWPIRRFPVIADDGQFVFEATGIIEYLHARSPETARLIPSDLPFAAEVRMWDRFFDNYVSYPQERLVFMAIGREPDDGKGGAAWKSMLETSYAFLDRRMAGRTWGCVRSNNRVGMKMIAVIANSGGFHSVGNTVDLMIPSTNRLAIRRISLRRCRPNELLSPQATEFLTPYAEDTPSLTSAF